MRFKIESLRVMRYLKGRGFTICDVKKRKRKTLYVMTPPNKWDGQEIEYWERDEKGVLVKVGKQEKVRAIVERVMHEPTLGLKKPTKKIAAPQQPLKLGRPAADLLEEAFGLLASGAANFGHTGKLRLPPEPVVETSRSGWQSLVGGETWSTWLPKPRELR